MKNVKPGSRKRSRSEADLEGSGPESTTTGDSSSRPRTERTVSSTFQRISRELDVERVMLHAHEKGLFAAVQPSRPTMPLSLNLVAHALSLIVDQSFKVHEMAKAEECQSLPTLARDSCGRDDLRAVDIPLACRIYSERRSRSL